MADGEVIAHMTGHGDKVFSLAVAPDGTIASGDMSPAKSGCGIRMGPGRRQIVGAQMLASQGGAVGSLRFSADGRLLLAACGVLRQADTRVHMSTTYHRPWKVISLCEARQYRARQAFSPDGRWAATGGGDNMEIHLWDPLGQAPARPDGKPLQARARARVWAAGFAADGRRIGWGNTGGVNVIDRGPLEIGLDPAAGRWRRWPRLLRCRKRGRPAPSAARRPALAASRFSHRKGGDYGYDAILDISKDGRAVASIARDVHEWLSAPVL